MSTRQQHYSGAKHAKRVRAYLEEWSKRNPGERTLRIENGANKNTKGQQKEKQADNEQMKKSKKNMDQQYEKSTNKNRKKIIKKSRGAEATSSCQLGPPTHHLVLCDRAG